jgi:hypothetical protein
VRLLVSLCSRTQEAPEIAVVCDPWNGEIVPVPLPGRSQGAFGLARVASTILCVLDLGRPTPEEPERSELCALSSETLTVQWRYSFRMARDAHSLCADDASLYVASTGTDELIELQLRQGRIVSEAVAWRPDDATERSDRHHLNTVARIADGLFVGGFGPRPTPITDWRQVRDGFVYSISSRKTVLESLYHPHSLCDLGVGEMALCESPNRVVITNKGRRSEMLPGYARGLCRVDGRLYVGTSRARKPSESQSILHHYPPPGADNNGVCALCQLDLETLTIEEVLTLEPHGREVYDVLPLG